MCTYNYFSELHIRAEEALNQVPLFKNTLIYLTTMNC